VTPLQRSRMGATAFFALNGFIGFSFLPRLAELQSDLGLDDAGLGVVLAVGTAGGLIVGPLGAPLIHRWGAVPVASVTGLVALPGLLLVGWGAVPAVVAIGLAWLLAADAVMDSAMNTRALEVEAAYGRSIINGFHAWWSLATIAGSGLGALSAIIGMPLGIFLSVVAAVSGIGLVVVWVAGTGVVPEGRQQRNDHRSGNTHDLSRRRAFTVMMASGGAGLAAFIMAAILVEDVPVRWGSVYLTSVTTDPGTWIAFAYVGLTTAMTIGRFTGDRVVDRVGEVRWIRWVMSAVAVTMAIALVVGTPLAFVVASIISGFGVATLFPAAMRSAARLPGVSPAMGVALVTWFSRAGFVVSPLAVGFIAQAAGIAWGMAVVVVAAIALIPLAVVVRRKRAVL
jgi:MFS family permease